MTLQALLDAGYQQEAHDFRGWVIRAVAGDPADMQIMYSITGKRHIPEWTLDWLPGYEGSRPVRIGNGAADQFQLDVYGELSDAAYMGRSYGMTARSIPGASWMLQLAVAGFVEQRWRDPDEGIWEVRGDRAALHLLQGDGLGRHRPGRSVHQRSSACRATWTGGRPWPTASMPTSAPTPVDPERNCFTQHYGSTAMDASLLMIPLVGFLPPDDPRIVNTVHEVARELGHDGLLLRYRDRRDPRRHSPATRAPS